MAEIDTIRELRDKAAQVVGRQVRQQRAEFAFREAKARGMKPRKLFGSTVFVMTGRRSPDNDGINYLLPHVSGVLNGMRVKFTEHIVYPQVKRRRV